MPRVVRAAALLATWVALSCSSSEEEPSSVLNHILSTGQSNSVGFAAHDILSREQPFGNVMFDTGTIPATRCDGDGCREYQSPTALVPLVEGDRYFDEPVETMSAGLANEIGLLARSRDPHPVLVTVHGRSGNTYECLRKGGCAYLDASYVKAFDEALLEMKDAHRLARASRRRYVVRAVTAIHGESDHYDKAFPLDGTDGQPGAIQTYADALVEWQRDYEEAVRAETGQSDGVPLLISQMANWNDRPSSDIPVHQLAAHDRAPGKVVLVGATYMLPFAEDCIHYTSAGERRLGEYFAKAYSRIVFERGTWEPLQPETLTLSGATITVRFHVPVPPLALDTEQVTDPGAYGFEYADDGPDTPTITGVELAGNDSLRITLSAPPTGGGRHLRYALRATPQTCPGPKTGPRGNLRDSDATPSQDGTDLANWAVAFDAPL